MAFEMAVHSLWVSRLLCRSESEGTMAQAGRQTRRKDNRLADRTLPDWREPIQIWLRCSARRGRLTVIRARPGLVQARTAPINARTDNSYGVPAARPATCEIRIQ